jgi:SpoVK/Ycf46/Vps4 family AAA+-type ATPase
MDIVDISLPQTSFESIVLNNFIMEEIAEFINSYKKRDEILRAGVEVISSLLLYGPPGCGKTTIAKYISFQTGLPLVTARLDGLISSLLGSTAKNIRKIFDYALKRDCILFLDEFDVIAKLRDDKHELGELKRVVNSLIQNIDDFNQNSILIAATNHHQLLDPAIWRRFSKIITLDKPNKEEILVLLRNLMSSINSEVIDSEKKLEQISSAFEGMSHADIKMVFNNCVKKAIVARNKHLHNWDLLQEIYFYKNHTIINEGDFIKFLHQYGLTHKEIKANFTFSLRKIREISKKPYNSFS